MHRTQLRGGKTHNLKGVDLTLEPATLVAIAGPSGSGKSSLALSTLYAEGQRRYVESFSAYARQFLERRLRPPVDELEPVPAAIAVDRQGPAKTSRSTVGTMTEVADYAKSLWAREATLISPATGRPVTRDSAPSIAKDLLPRGDRAVITYPVAVADAERFLDVRDGLLREGFRRLWVEGAARDLDGIKPSELAIKKPKRSRSKKRPKVSEPPTYLDVVVDRVSLEKGSKSRVTEGIELALGRGGGRVDVHFDDGGLRRYSSALHCPDSDQVFRDPVPAMFSFNNPLGACEACRGFGRVIAVDYDKVLPDLSASIRGGAIAPWQGKSTTWERRQLRKFAAARGISLETPIGTWAQADLDWLILGDEDGWPHGWFGLAGWFDWLESRAYKMHVRVLLSRYRKYDPCPDCGGARLKPESLYWKIDGKSIADFFAMPVSEARTFLADATKQGDAASRLLAGECIARMKALEDVGLGYLTLDRQSRTLSGGETQRVALTSALGASLEGALLVLDEPTVGLHPSDVEKLAVVVERLAEAGNTVVVVEHDADMIRAAHRVVEMGPGAGEHGGRIVFDGAPQALAKAETKTAEGLRMQAASDRKPRRSKHVLTLKGASGHNLKRVDIEIPLQALTCVTGVSGSGKSSLIRQTLLPALDRKATDAPPLPFTELLGADAIRRVVDVDQSPLGRTSRGNPATYMKVWDVFRRRFADEPSAKKRGLGPGAFSFNVAGGRCEACKGQGFETIEMQFLADVSFSCVACGGKRFTGEVLGVRYAGLSVDEVLELTVDDALSHFAGDKTIELALSPLAKVGLGYIRLGQPLNTLSGGEAQRLKLASAFAGTKPGALLILDEPTAGLHPTDVAPLIALLHDLVDRGDTVVVIEHDMQVAASADRIIDIGPGAGAEGGEVVAVGTPREIAKRAQNKTGIALARFLEPTKTKATKPGVRASKTAAYRPAPLEVTSAREHNLKDVSVRLDKEQLVVVTGPSGSGKSSLAFDVIYAEGQRRYLETLSPYARQYLPQLPRPDVDRVSGLSPTVSLEQRMTRGGASSTVATMTEVAHYLRLLYARIGDMPSDELSRFEGRSPEQIADEIASVFRKNANVDVYAVAAEGRKGMFKDVFERALKEGIREARIDGTRLAIETNMALSRYQEHDIELLIAERMRAGDHAVLVDSLRRAALAGEGDVLIVGKGKTLTRSIHARDASSRPVLDPRLFSFNTRQGACSVCEGRGAVVSVVGRGRGKREVLSHCDACDGTRLGHFARSITIDGASLSDLTRLSVSQAKRRIAEVKLTGRDRTLGDALLEETQRKLGFLEQVGLGYLGLDRGADTLSGGEAQRVRLAAQLGSGLTGVLYVLDEPTIGLHPRDTAQLLGALRTLVDLGNTVLVVEHDADTIRAADVVIDVGPGGGHHGGRIVAQGPLAEIAGVSGSKTGQALARPLREPSHDAAIAKAPALRITGAREHNLKAITASFPLGALSVVTGVSGSGKSTLVRRVLLPAVRRAVGLVTDAPGAFGSLTGAETIQRVVEVDQSPIGRTPRSVPATYVGIWDEMRALLARVPEARARGYDASRFSFNVDKGRCPACQGNGSLIAEMAFLPDVHLPCGECGGMRFDRETLSVQLHGLSAGQILELEVEQAAEVFAVVPRVKRALDLLCQLGLGYLKLGQASNTLSGGEAQRLKLVSELATSGRNHTLYVFDEPTTGLHRDDVERLLTVLRQLTERGDTVLIIEHNPDVIAAADWLVDLGPEGGEHGGEVVVMGTPRTVLAHETSHTAAMLRHELDQGKATRPRRKRRSGVG